LIGSLCLAFWLSAFADNTTHESLTVNAFVDSVLEANPQLKISAATWQAAVANIDQQGHLNDPQLHYRFAPKP